MPPGQKGGSRCRSRPNVGHRRSADCRAAPVAPRSGVRVRGGRPRACGRGMEPLARRGWPRPAGRRSRPALHGEIALEHPEEQHDDDDQKDHSNSGVKHLVPFGLQPRLLVAQGRGGVFTGVSSSRLVDVCVAARAPARRGPRVWVVTGPRRGLLEIPLLFYSGPAASRSLRAPKTKAFPGPERPVARFFPDRDEARKVTVQWS